MKKKEEKKPLNVKKMVTLIVCGVLCLIAVILICIWDDALFTPERCPGLQIFVQQRPVDLNADPVVYETLYGWNAIGYWLSSNGSNILYTFVMIAVIAILIVALVIIAKFIRFRNKKAATIFSLVLSCLKWVFIVAGVILILQRWLPNQMRTVIASIGIITLIIGLGCQTLISDVVAGIFLVADGAFEVGDIVVVDNFRGTVVEIGMKSTKLEDAGGNIKVISNSAISTLVNLTNTLSLSIVDISIPYEENLARTETLLIERLKDMKKRIPAIVEGPYYKGVEDMGDSAVILKVIAKVKEEDRFQCTRDMKRDIYIFLNENKITVPYPQVTITQGPNPADHPEWVDKEKEEEKALREAQKQQEESKNAELANDEAK